MTLILFLEKFTLFFLGVVFLVSLILYFFQNMFIYHPNYPPGSRKKMDTSYFHTRHEEVRLECSDGTQIQAWFLKQLDVDYKSAPTMVYFHGNAGNISHCLSNAEDFYRTLKCNVLLVEYRGYGFSEGKPSEAGFYQDAEAGLQHLLSRSDICKSNVIVFGRSVGGAVAVWLAAHHPDEISALLIENTFTSLAELVVHLFPFVKLPKRLLSFLLRRNCYNSISLIKKVQIPILFVSGRADELVPPLMMDQLYDSAKSSPRKRLAKVAGGRHNETWLMSEYYKNIEDFVTALFQN